MGEDKEGEMRDNMIGFLQIQYHTHSLQYLQSLRTNIYNTGHIEEYKSCKAMSLLDIYKTNLPQKWNFKNSR